MKFRKTLKVLAASALLFGTVGLATACGDNNGGTTDVKGLIINEDAKVIRGDFNLVTCCRAFSRTPSCRCCCN